MFLVNSTGPAARAKTRKGEPAEEIRHVETQILKPAGEVRHVETRFIASHPLAAFISTKGGFF